MILATLGGLFLIIAGVTFLLWQPPSSATGSVVSMAVHLSDHQHQVLPPHLIDPAVLHHHHMDCSTVEIHVESVLLLFH